MDTHNNPLDCLRCKSAIKHPVRLPCQHHFCRHCIQSDQCHICGRSVILSDLAEDKVLNYVVESSREKTETCANCDQISQPMFFCETCQQPLCSECRESTHKAKIFSLHHIVELEERGRIRNRPLCPVHNEPFILFCLDSKSLMCIECFNSTSLERRGHFVNIDVAHKICCDKLEKIAANLRSFQHELVEQIELRRRMIMELEKNGEQLNTEIEQKCDEIMERVKTLKKQLLKKVVNERREKQEKISAQLGQFLHLESPVSINLLSISIFCSYASKIDVLYCYADLYKTVQQFLASNGQLVQKVKFDCALAVDLPTEFNLMVCQPMNFFLTTSTVGTNVFLDCNPTAVITNNVVDPGMRSTNGSTEKDDQSLSEIRELSSTRNMFDALEIIDSHGTTPIFTPNDSSIPFNIFQTQLESGGENIADQRFMEQFQHIAVPLRNFAQEISSISKGLMDLQKDITLRRCVVNGEELMNRIACCEDAWDRLEAHNKRVQKILSHFMGQFWRKEIERVQRQQRAIREKVDEMKQLQKLAQRALQISQQLKPFATQMANLISVIDVRRCGPILPSPMERICLEIAQIEPDSAGRVAAIEKEEEARRLAKSEETKAQFSQKEAVQMRRSLKEVKIPTVKQQRTSLVLEMDRDRAPTRGSNRNEGGTNSCLSSPLAAIKKRQQLHRHHRNSESAISSVETTSPSAKMFISEELTESLAHESEGGKRQRAKAPPVATVSPTILPVKEESKKVEEGEEDTSNEQEEEEGGTAGRSVEGEEIGPELSEREVVEPVPQPPPIPVIHQPPNSSTTTTSHPFTAGASIIRSQTQDRDPALIAAREKLLAAIREKVKKIDP